MKTILYTWFAVLLFGMAAVSCGDDDTKKQRHDGHNRLVVESIGNGGRRPHDQEIHVQGLRQLGGAKRQTGMVQDTHLVGRQGQRPAAQHLGRSQRDRQHAQREHHRTGERLREGGAVRHHPAREQQRRHGRRHRAQQTGRQDPGVLLPVERRIPAKCRATSRWITSVPATIS